MSALRVLHVLPTLRGYGAERQVMDLLASLQSPALSAGALTIYGSGTEEQAALLPFQVLEGGRTRRADYFFLHRLTAQMRRFKPDVVHAHTHVGKYWGRLAAMMSGIRRIVFTEHNPCDPRRSLLESIVDPIMHHYTDRVVTFFAEQRLELAVRDRIAVDKIVTIPNGLPPPEAGAAFMDRAAARKLLGVPDERFAMLLVGRLEYQKNQQLAMRALAALDGTARGGVHLFIAGTGSDDEALRELACALDIEQNVSFLGYRNDVRALMRGCDLLLMTSLFEGMPLSLIEAMLAGTPILSTPWTGVREMLDDGRYGFITSGWQPESVAESVERAMLSPGARIAMAQRALVYARETYSISRMADAHKKLYAELAEGA